MDSLSFSNRTLLFSIHLVGLRETVRLGEKEVDYNDNFRLYMTTRRHSASIGSVQPECATSLVTVVNFQTTRAGLVSQLLDIILQHERAELETRRLELLKGEETKKLELAQLEDKLLEVHHRCHYFNFNYGASEIIISGSGCVL